MRTGRSLARRTRAMNLCSHWVKGASRCAQGRAGEIIRAGGAPQCSFHAKRERRNRMHENEVGEYALCLHNPWPVGKRGVFMPRGRTDEKDPRESIPPASFLSLV